VADRGGGHEEVLADGNRFDDGDVDIGEAPEGDLVAKRGDVAVVERDSPVVDGLSCCGPGLERVASRNGAGLDERGVDLVADAPETADCDRRVRGDRPGRGRRRPLGERAGEALRDDVCGHDSSSA
jgi:hypothetical protein